jgi:hypothetical protein
MGFSITFVAASSGAAVPFKKTQGRMKLEAKEINDILSRHFSGGFVFAPVHLSGHDGTRPLRQLLNLSDISPTFSYMRPQTLGRRIPSRGGLSGIVTGER